MAKGAGSQRADGRGALLPKQAREIFRAGTVTHTSGYSRGYAQANLITLPEKQAFDFLLFAQRNPKPCPLLGVLEAGQVSSELLADGDIRTDIPLYRVYRDGQLESEVPDVRDIWRDDLVSFIIGCSFTFESALLDNGVPVEHISRARTCQCIARPFRRTRPEYSLAPWSFPCAPFRLPRWPMRCELLPATRRCTGHLCTWAIPPQSALKT